MSQPPPPPPPPGRPPSGGFGPPQEPPSYGYPQQEQQPGYGYPQQTPPPPPYGQPSGYGYPQQQPGQPPYGPAYGQYDQYGQPGQYGQYGQYPQQQPPGGGRNKAVAVVAAVVAVLLIVGGGIFFLAKGDGGTEAGRDTGGGTSTGGTGGSGGTGGTQHKGSVELLWEVGTPDLSKLDGTVVESNGTWIAEGRLVNASFDAVTAYDAVTGKAAWSIDLVRGPKCAAAPDASDNKTVLQWGRRCEKIMAIDLAAGKELWRKDLPTDDRGSLEFSSTEMAVSGNTAAAAWIGNAVGYDLTTGKALWAAEQSSKCEDRSYVGGARLIAKVECDYGEEQSLQLVEEDGGKGWEWKAPTGIDITNVFSVDPLVIGVQAGDAYEVTDIMAIDDNGKLRSKITIPEKSHMFSCEGISLAACHNVVVDKANDAVYLQTYIRTGNGGSVTDIEAFDLASGKSKWVSKPTEDRHASPLAMQDGKLLGYEMPSYDTAGLITSIDPKTGKAAPYVRMPDDQLRAQRDMTAVGSGRPYWHDGRIFLVRHKYYDDASLNKGGILAFG